MQLPKVTQLGMAGLLLLRHWDQDPPGPACPGQKTGSTPLHLHLSAAERPRALESHLPRAQVPLLTHQAQRQPRSSAYSWCPRQATHTSHRLCVALGQIPHPLGTGTPSPAGSCPERAPAGTEHSTCSHTGRHHLKHLRAFPEHLLCTSPYVGSGWDNFSLLQSLWGNSACINR